MLNLVLPNMNMTESFLATLYQQSLYPEFHAGHSVKEKAFRQHGSCGNTGFHIPRSLQFFQAILALLAVARTSQKICSE